MSSITFQHHLPLLPSNTSLIIAAASDNAPTIKPPNFGQIPSWLSLKTAPSSLKTPQQNQPGKVENLHLVSLSKQEKLKEARAFLEQMGDAGVSVRPYSFECLLQACSNLKSVSDGRYFYHRLRETVKNPSGFLQNSVLRMYCDCGSLVEAQKVFDEMIERTLVSWLIIISAYAEAGFFNKSFRLFSDMIESGIEPNSLVYNGLLKYLVSPCFLELGKQLHSHVVRSGLSSSVSINTAICNMYVKCGCLDDAKRVFGQMDEKDSVASTALMVGFTQAEKLKDALNLFEKMVVEGNELDEFVFSIVLKACAGLKDLNLGRQIHGFVVKLGLESDVSVGTPLVDFYIKCSSFEPACRAFERIREPSDVSWSAMICGYCQNGKFEDSVKIFKSLRSKGPVLNSWIYTNIFQACSALADFNLGGQAHADAMKNGVISYLYGESALVSMYSRCGRLDYATQAFELIDAPDTVAWTAIISGNSYHGNASEALRLFRRMQYCGVRPNAVTFIAVLTACSHSGLITEAKHFMDTMLSEYGVNPTIDHYNCMIDIYSRAGLLKEANELIKSMPFDPDTMSWKCLLGGCWVHKNFELGKIGAENLLQLDPEDTSSYILLFNLHTSSGKWEEAANIRKMMTERNLRKELSCSWITVKGKVHRFVVGDKHHPQTEEIYSKLKEFNDSMLNHEHGLLTEEDLSASLPERKEQLLDHSERLAISFGLMSTPTNAPIVIFKNLRACKDCHDFAKHVSAVTGRKIVVRDASRFHHFHSGQCSCNDYW
ncbi:pentatricopeptide repeat-containing protein At5g13270, chloroplastic-like [Pistacia vera]|uniref:pentatricopeptide repeat-containing protein At5g13270, chloroplastic-like n=1 Tax=Pistacia vera TaxID=55513 RepID=UPI0012630A97|nr:pentatricopeptide repeat-containing protein At5g13270, chloroplastic-like [Pistacia vera]